MSTDTTFSVGMDLKEFNKQKLILDMQFKRAQKEASKFGKDGTKALSDIAKSTGIASQKMVTMNAKAASGFERSNSKIKHQRTALKGLRQNYKTVNKEIKNEVKALSEVAITATITADKIVSMNTKTINGLDRSNSKIRHQRTALKGLRQNYKTVNKEVKNTIHSLGKMGSIGKKSISDVNKSTETVTASVKKLSQETKTTSRNTKQSINEQVKANRELHRQALIHSIQQKRARKEAIATGKKSVEAMKNVQRATEKTTKSVRKMTKTTKDGFDKSNKAAKNQTSTIKKLAGAYLGLAGARKLFRSTVSLGKKIVEETGELQTAGEKWEIFTGSVESAQIMLKQLFDFSHRTPFTFKDVNKAATELFVLTDGALQGVDAIEQVAERAALAKVPMERLTLWWGRLYTKMQAGRPMGRALTAMQRMGIVSNKLRSELAGLSKSEMMDGTGWKTFIEGTSKADGAIKRLAQTIEGKSSTLSGVWDQMFAFKDDESRESITRVIQGMIDALNTNTPRIQTALKDIFSIFGTIAENAISSFALTMEKYADIIDSFDPSRKFNRDITVSQNVFTRKSTRELEQKEGQLQIRQQPIVAELLTPKIFSSEDKKTIDKLQSFELLTPTQEKLLQALISRGKLDEGQLNVKEAIESNNISTLLNIIANSKVIKTGEDKELDLVRQFVKVEQVRLSILKELKGRTKTFESVITAVSQNQSADTTADTISDKVAKITAITLKDVFRGLNTFNLKDRIDPLQFGGLDFSDRQQDITPSSLKAIGEGLGDLGFLDVAGRQELHQKDISKIGADIEKTDFGLKERTERDKLQQQAYDDFFKEQNAAQEQFYSSSLSLIGNSENAILNLHKTFAAKGVAEITRGMSNLSNTTSSILGNLSDLGVSGLGGVLKGAGFIGAGLSLFSSAIGLLDSDESTARIDPAEDTSSFSASSSPARASIVSSGSENVYVTNNIEINTNYIGDDAGLRDFVEDDIVPILNDASTGVLA